MNLLVYALGAWFGTEAASGRYSKPVSLGVGMLVARLGAPAAMMMLAGLALKKLRDDGAFESMSDTPMLKKRAEG